MHRSLIFVHYLILAGLVLAAPACDSDTGDDDTAADGGTDAAAADTGPALPGRDVSVAVDTTAVVAEVSDEFISLAIENAFLVGGYFWTPEASPQEGAGTRKLDPYDFDNEKLRQYTELLAPAYIRLGGTTADKIYYDLGDSPVASPPEGYESILTRALWDGVNAFAEAVGLRVMFTLNAGPGPRDADLAWQPDNARELIRYTVEKGYPVDSWELGNEINYFPSIHGDEYAISGEQYAADMVELRKLVDVEDPDALVAGPASAYWPGVGELRTTLPVFMEYGGENVDIVSWHFYPQQSRRCPVALDRASPDRLLDPKELDEIHTWADEVEAARDEYAPDARVWLGETGNAQCGGEPDVSDAFVGGLWWADELGLIARRGQQVVVRQALFGSNYGLLDETTLDPYPDFWNSLLWKRLMGKRVLDVTSDDDKLRAYAHCMPSKPGALTVLLINLDHRTDAVVELDGSVGDAGRESYYLSAPDMQAREIRLNGERLDPLAEGESPALSPREEKAGAGVRVGAVSYAFFVFPDAAAPACK